MKKMMFMSIAVMSAFAWGETICVPAGETVKVEPGRVFTGGALVKTGAGALDVSGARLANAGLDVREGVVKLSGGDAAAVAARYLRWHVTKTRPGKSGPPEYAGSGSQFSEFRLFRGGKMLPMPKGATAMNAVPGHREGPQMGIDGNLKTKCYHNTFIADFGEEIAFDGYSFATANDAIGRDPFSWSVDVGVVDGSAIVWMNAGVVDGFEAPKERFAEAGKIFPVHVRDVVPPNYPISVGGKGCLLLVDVNEMLEDVQGDGLIQLERATVDFGSKCGFSGTVAGDGSVVYRKP